MWTACVPSALPACKPTIYLLMAGAELNAQGALVMPVALAEPRLSLPASGLYANIANLEQKRRMAVVVDARAQSVLFSASRHRASGTLTP